MVARLQLRPQVRISAPGPLPAARLGSSASLRPGEWVVALGSPLSLSNTITAGVVSNKARPPDEMGLQGRDLPEYIQTDAAITFGNSGGPLINLDGEVIGINSMKVTPGISFAIPIDYAKEFLRKSREAAQGGAVLKERRFIGITMITLNHQLVEELKARTQLPASVTHGILVHRVVQGGPAHRAGILTGDILTHINSQPVHGSRDVYKLLEGSEELVCTVVRDMKAFRATVRPEAYHA
jgi:HtrA serine peptidase 2